MATRTNTGRKPSGQSIEAATDAILATEAVVDPASFATKADALAHVRERAAELEAILVRTVRVTITIKTDIGLTLIHAARKELQRQGKALPKAWTYTNVANALDINNGNAVALTGFAYQSLGEVVDFGRSYLALPVAGTDDFIARAEAEVAVLQQSDPKLTFNAKSARKALNKAVDPTKGSSREAGAAKTKAAIAASFTQGKVVDRAVMETQAAKFDRFNEIIGGVTSWADLPALGADDLKVLQFVIGRALAVIDGETTDPDTGTVTS